MKSLVTLIGLFFTLPLFAQPLLDDPYPQAANLYQHGRGDPDDFPEALKLFEKAANAGRPEAQFYAGRMHQLGHGTERNGKRAAAWYALAGENGQARAFNNLGNIYATGQDIPRDGERALECYVKASEMGMAMGSYNAGLVYMKAKNGIERDFAQARFYYRRCLQQYPNYPGAWNNLGRVLRANSDDVESDYKGAEQAFLKAIEQGDHNAYWNLADLYYDKRAPASGERIIELLELGGKHGDTDCLNRLGWLYQKGKFVEPNIDASIGYYERSAKLGDDDGMNWLAVLLLESGQETSSSPRVVKLLQQASSQGNLYAMNNLGYRMITEDIPGYTAEDGVALLIKAAQAGNEDAQSNLLHFANNLSTAALISEKQRDWLETQVDAKAQEAKAMARQALKDTSSLVKEQQYDAAISMIESRLNNWEGVDQNERAFLDALWWDAQTQQGRADPEWSWRLFDWLKMRYDHHKRGMILNRLVVRYNAATALIECGRIGMLHQLSDEMRTILAQIDGIDIESVFSSAKSRSGYPLRYSADMLTGYKSQETEGGWISDAAMSALAAIAKERTFAADWQTVDQLCDWMEAWALAVLDSGQIPRGATKGFVMETYLDALLIRAQAHEYRFDYASAEAAYNKIIELDWQVYDGKSVDIAMTRRGRLLAITDRFDELDEAQLSDLVERRQSNQYDTEQGHQFSRLVNIRRMHALGAKDQAVALSDEVLEYAKAKQRPFLRLEALLVAIDLALVDKRYGNIEAQLFEALNWTREKGLKVAEPAIYARYVDYLIAKDQLGEAQKIQLTQIELMERLNASKGLPDAWAKLAVIYRLQGNHSAELQTLKEHPIVAERHAERIDELSALANQTKPSADLSFDLQPMRITSTPLPGQGLEAIFTLSNLGATPSKVFLQAQANQGLMFKDVLLPEAAPIVMFMPGDNHPTQDETVVTLEAQEQRFIHVKLAKHHPVATNIQLSLVAQRENTEVISELLIQANAAAASTAIIEAHELETNPFYLVSAFHHLANANPDDPKDIALRTLASQPTRVEAYDFSGKLLFIDAQGNGRFTDPGDVLATKQIVNNAPLLELQDALRVIELRYLPLDNSSDQTVQIELQRAAASEQLHWRTEAVDRIVPFQSTLD